MTTVAAIKMRYNPKAFWFDPQKVAYAQGDYVLVETERGREVGLVLDGALEVSESQIKKLKTPLKPVIRALSDIDFDHLDALDAKGRNALPTFREMIAKHQLDIKAVQVEYLFSGDKAVFYFASDVRVDFRELVRDLVSVFHIRVDMRQIGARDEARIVGGLAHCGEELCCARLGGEFQSVSIRMAKEQDLPLNPVKISGACGRLMCCLRYEFEAYKEFKQRAPKKGLLVQTPLGTAKIVDYDTPREIIHLRLEDGKSLAIPLTHMDCKKDDKGCVCSCCVSRETIDQFSSPNIMLALSAMDRANEKLEDSLFASGGRLAGGTVDTTRTKRRRRRSEDGGTSAALDGAGVAGGGRSARPASGAGASGDGRSRAGAGGRSAVGGGARLAGAASRGNAGQTGDQLKGRSRRRRREEAPGAGGFQLDAQKPRTDTRQAARDTGQEVRENSGKRGSQSARQEFRPRPGQHSSGVRNPQKRRRPQQNRPNGESPAAGQLPEQAVAQPGAGFVKKMAKMTGARLDKLTSQNVDIQAGAGSSPDAAQAPTEHRRPRRRGGQSEG